MNRVPAEPAPKPAYPMTAEDIRRNALVLAALKAAPRRFAAEPVAPTGFGALA